MTVKEIDARLCELDDEICELEEQTDEEHFCDDCGHIRVYQDVEEYWGARCIRETPVCDADFCPYYSDCPRHDEYEALQARLEAARKEYERLDAAYETAQESEA